MSVNKSVQAAQRRRAGPTNADPGIPGRGPQHSINSAQMFANQAKPGQGPNMPIGRLAGQQVQQTQQQQMYPQDIQQKSTEKLSSVNKMTIPQAITLITLRLGAIESKLLHMPEGGHEISMEGNSIDSGLLQTIMARLESLENRTSTTGTVPTSDLNLLKQQFETIKHAVVQTKSSSASLVKENILLKTQIDNMKNELIETKELVCALQNLTTENSKKILDISMGITETYVASNIDELNELQYNPDSIYTEDFSETDQSEIVGTDLKKLIESELNTST